MASPPPTDRSPAPDPDQLAQVHHGVVDDGPARGQRVIAVHPAGGLHVRLLPDRGLDVGAAWYAGRPVAFLSRRGETAAVPGDWLTGWGGGLLTTCGLRNVGEPSEGHPQHGTVHSVPARDVRVDRSVTAAGGVQVCVSGTVTDADATRPGLRLHRTITLRTDDAVVEVVDVTTNLGHRPEQAPILYHVNFGPPFLEPASGIRGEVTVTRARDRASEEAGRALDWRATGPPVEEERDDVHEHSVPRDADGWSRLRLTSPSTRTSAEVSWDPDTLPRLHTWRRPTFGSFVRAIEPANCSVRGRVVDRDEGRAPWLAPGENRRTRVTVRFSTDS